LEDTVPQVTIGRWKKTGHSAPWRDREAAGLSNGERLDIETLGGEIVIRRAVSAFQPGGAVSREER